MVLPVYLGPSLPPEFRLKSPPVLAAGVSWVFPLGGLSGTAVSFGICHFLIPVGLEKRLVPRCCEN